MALTPISAALVDSLRVLSNRAIESALATARLTYVDDGMQDDQRAVLVAKYLRASAQLTHLAQELEGVPAY